MSATSTMHNYRSDIDGLRAIAVLAVVGFHAFPTVFRGGFVGVDIFFVISGYLISSIIFKDLSQNTFSFCDFYARRIRRIFPALCVVLGAVLLFGWYLLFPHEYQWVGKHVAGGAAFISNILLLLETGYFNTEGALKPLLHLWSLGIEEQFYILFPLLLFICRKNTKRMLYAVIFFCVSSFVCNLAMYKVYHSANFYLPVTRFWELLIGSILAYVTHYMPELKSRLIASDRISNILSIVGIIFIVIAVFAFKPSRHFPGVRALLPVLGCAFLIVAGQSATCNRKLLAGKRMVAVGLISYPLYLWHWPLLSYAIIINGDTPPLLLRLLLVAISFLLAWCTYVFVEKNIRFNPAGRKCKTFAAICAMILLGCAGFYIAGDGLPKRSSMSAHSLAFMEALRQVPQYDEAGACYTQEVPKNGEIFYRYHDAGGLHTVAVLGDSHATSAFPGIAEVNARNGVNTVLLGVAGPERPFVGQEKFVSERKRQEQIERTTAILDFLTKRAEIKQVFIFVRGMVYISGKHIGGRDTPHITPPDAYKEILQNTADVLLASGKEVFIVTENPELPSKGIARYIKRILRPEKTLPRIYRKDVLQRQEPYLKLLEELEGVTVINSIELFCPTELCDIFSKDGYPYYFDDDHLSSAGSIFQAEEQLLPYLIKK